MMVLDVVLPLIALALLALFFAAQGVKSSASPLAAVGATTLFFTLFGCFGLLRVGGILYYAVVVGALGWLCWRTFRRKKALPRLGWGFWFFFAASVGVISLLAAKKPMFIEWDEFSFWGTASKLTVLYNEFYTTAPVGWNWAASQTPALISFNYFFQFFGDGFSEWQTYAAYDIFLFSAFAALLAPFGKKDGWKIALPVAVIALLTPYVFVQYNQPEGLSRIYMDSYGDIPMGVMFGGVLVAYFGSAKKTLRELIPVFLALATLTLIKDYISLALAFVALVLMLADYLFQRREDGHTLKGNAKGALARFAIGLGAVLLPFLTWSIYTATVAGVDRTNLGGKDNISLFAAPARFFTELFSGQQSEIFKEVTAGMPRLFASSKITMVGSGAVVVALILAMVAFAAFITQSRALRRRCILFGVFSTLGFAAYYWFITLSYIYLFRSDQVFESYNRYIYPYYIGWFLAAVLLVGVAAKNARFVVEGKLALVALAAVLCLRWAQVVPVQYSVLGFDASEYNVQREIEGDVRNLTDRLPKDGKTFIVSGDDNGLKWFTYCYKFLPWQVDYSFGGGFDGKLVEMVLQPGGDPLEHELTADEWAAYLVANDCTSVFVDNAGDYFTNRYGHLFGDELEHWEEVRLYNVEVNGDKVRLVPIS